MPKLQNPNHSHKANVEAKTNREAVLLVKQDLPKMGISFFFNSVGLEIRTTVSISKKFCMGVLAFESWDCD